MPNFNHDEYIRYQRQFSLAEIGVTGQEKLKSASVLCIGAGGIGSPALYYLAAAGIGKIGIVDNDHVELSNLQRQILYTESDCGQLKANVAKQRISSLNKNINLQAFAERLTTENAESLISQYQLVIDGSDNFQTRYLVNDVCYTQGKPLLSASVQKFTGQLTLFNDPKGPCYRCLYPNPPGISLIPNCADAGVLGVVPGLLGTFSAGEAIKYFLNIGDSLQGKLAIFDQLKFSFEHFNLKKNPDCLLCAKKKPFHQLPTAAQPSCNSTNKIPNISVQQLQAQLKIKKEEIKLLDVRQDWERKVAHIPNSEHLPLKQLLTTKPSWNKGDMIVIYCESGKRSQSATSYLIESGFNNCYSLQGGIQAYNAQPLN